MAKLTARLLTTVNVLTVCG